MMQAPKHHTWKSVAWTYGLNAALPLQTYRDDHDGAIQQSGFCENRKAMLIVPRWRSVEASAVFGRSRIAGERIFW